MKSIKSTLAALIVLGFSVNAFAMSDDNYLSEQNDTTVNVLSFGNLSNPGDIITPVNDER